MAPDPALASDEKRAARAARFSQVLPGNRYKELEELRQHERKAFEQKGLIKVGKTELEDAVDLRGTCERMCSDYEREFREWTREVNPFEATPDRRMDPAKAVAAYSRSDAGAGHGDSAILPSDLRTPLTLMKTLDYLFSSVMPTPPPTTSIASPADSARKALGYTAGFIRDRTRAIRKEFAMQSSWGHEEAIASFERIARWHILCLRELQEEGGTNNDMHIDSAELGRCFVSLRQHYNDRREESGLDLPCANEPEFRAYMLIYDLTSKSVSIPTAELPTIILDHPLVKLAWDIRRSAQRNFDSQKEGSKLNAELGANLITRFIKLLKQAKVPYLLGCLVEIRLREIRRSALRSLVRSYPRLRTEPVRTNESGEIVERKMILLSTLNHLLGCEPQDETPSAWDDVPPTSSSPSDESISIIERFNIPTYTDPSSGTTMGALINLGTPFNDNKDAPYTRRWALVSGKRGDADFVDVVNGRKGVGLGGGAAEAPAQVGVPGGTVKPTFGFARPKAIPAAPKPEPAAPAQAQAQAKSAFDFQPPPPSGAKPPTPAVSAFGAAPAGQSAFSFKKPALPPSAPPSVSAPVPAGVAAPAFGSVKSPAPVPTVPKPAPAPAESGERAIPNFFSKPSTPAPPPSLPPQPQPSTTLKTEPPSFSGQNGVGGGGEGTKAPFSFGLPPPPPNPASEGKEAEKEVKQGEGEDRKGKRRADDESAGKKPMFTFGAPKPTEPSETSSKADATAVGGMADATKSTFSFTTPAPPPTTTSTPAGPSLGQVQVAAKAPSPPPAPIAHARKDPYLLLSTSAPPRLSKSTSKPLSELHTKRLQRKAALPAVTDLLLVEVMRAMVQDHLGVEVEGMVNQQMAERRHVQMRRWRKEAIGQWSQSVFTDLITSEIRAVARKAVVRDLRRRYILRRAVQHWQAWAKERRERREMAVKKREEMYDELRAMGLSRSVAAWGVQPVGSGSELGHMVASTRTWSRSLELRSGSDTARDSLTIDIEMTQAERNKDNFFAPSTFLQAIARHISPHLSPSSPFTPDIPYNFITLLSVPPAETDHFGSAPDSQVQEWLVKKFTAGDEGVQMGGVHFGSTVVKDGKVGRQGWVGLVVFEAPVKTSDSKKAQENVASAQDRIGALVKLLNSSTNRYSPPLMVLTWEDETLADLAARLEIQDELSAFETKALVSLEVSNDLDTRFVQAIEALYEFVDVKEQVVVRLQDVVEAVHFSWDQFLDVAGMVVAQRPRNLDAAWTCLRSGIDLINQFAQLTTSSAGSSGLLDDTDFEPIILPKPQDQTFDSPPKFVESLAEYLESDTLVELDELNLLLTQASYCSQNDAAIPIAAILRSLSSFVFGELRHKSLFPRVFLPTPTGVRTWLQSYIESVSRQYETYSSQAIQQLVSLAPSSPVPVTIEIDNGAFFENKAGGRKRTREKSDSGPGKVRKETKANKVAKLMRAMRRAEKSLGGEDVA
ncbi:hypothetical protein I350_03911 [Cryptococcus amylolentus CBS 6273]|uniref:SAC3/GANP/THP3 conserved domain-containing protein n=1 Tax=Cryptococcus amylolentus CBS 6273 TaxID=1296118 RepID=A0A1E3K0G8_9TREE|nr:hypothetical protein I350_03911 [Cryptococcus amylolentus CBS 6273]